MAVTVRQKSEVVGSGTSPTVTEPAGAAQGDVLFAIANGDSFSAGINAPSGWTNLYGPTVNGASTSRVDYISRGASAPDLTWVISGTSYREVHIVCLQSSTTTVALDSQSSTGTTGNSNHQPDPPATTAVASASLAVSCGLNFSGALAGGWTPSTGYTVQTVNGTGVESLLESKVLSASGSENPSAFANGSTSAQPWWDGATTTWTDAVAADVLLIAPAIHQGFRQSRGVMGPGGIGPWFN